MMHQAHVTIAGAGFYVPPRVVTNNDLSQRLETDDEWIVQRTGIRQRHLVEESVTTTDLATRAAWAALDQSGTAAEEIDLVIVATSTPDDRFPSTAARVQHAIGATHAAAFDLSAACSGFVYATAVGSQWIETGCFRNALVVGVDVFSRIVDWRDRRTAILFGDGAGAVLLRRTEKPYPYYLSLGADGSGGELLRAPMGGPVSMNGTEVYKFGVRIIPSLLQEALQALHLTIDDLALVIPHQANARIIESAAKKGGYPFEKFFLNVDRYGNTSAASIPIALTEALQQKVVREGDLVAMIGFGGGLTWGIHVLSVYAR
ncbi:beta-ketoacyl-ACP synthase III [Parageobacillus thermoglucosidasius]|uniref:beta-ketoacyl-ACP synthase III n=1 Tax=Parageobacillus thermoglucosidasius TaxID=1426 RepID=UPI00025B3E5E|nr:beta-ketoacyl-ACP synthase III [Parageobacillus thermoglucosidasius]EID42996.1 3-oxoacyl-(acyl carrier protein) synthase III [Parageobacillus thermoglucosidasius TNO-09.020]KYD18022.1 3-oxoacyl-[acyl-carrier-protein] synthase, KASIII [Anoxybacillus flavithermus]OAO85197.1 3-oxoacyl-(acyl-carrier-protein) synthase KASIII [Parageobacillus thermoglucosidasius]